MSSGLVFSVVLAIFGCVPSYVKAGERLTGTMIEGGAVCPLMRSSDGRTIALVGLPRAMRDSGIKLVLVGKYLKHSQCQQGDATFEIERVIAS